MSEVAFCDQPEAVRSEQDDVEAAVVELLDADDLADAADRGTAAAMSSSIRSAGSSDATAAVERVADHVAVARLEDVERQLRARKEDRPGQREEGDPERRGSCEQQRRQAPPLRAGPGIFEPWRFEHL